MKIASLFDLINDSRDVLDFFERVESTEQLITRLDRLKRQGTDDMLMCLDSLRHSIDTLLADTLEMSPSLGDEPDDDDDMSELDKTLAELGTPDDSVTPPTSTPPDNAKKDGTDQQ
jgi:hypothetical protein